ncbi:hypothetical protein Aduo_016456 [Ancylostoma duodenale]
MASGFPIVASLLYIIIANVALRFLNDFSFPVSQENSTQVEENDAFTARDLLAQIPPRQVDVLCSEKTHYCFVITERSETFEGRLMVFRGLQVRKDHPGLLLSYARLLIPKELTFAMLLDTRPWKLDKTTVRLVYARTMIAGVFVSGAVQYNSTKNHNVLIVGLGGGVINNYLSSMPNQRLNITVVDIDPVMKKIAEKWYDFKESELHRIVVEDGIKYAKQASARGEKFDAILLDLCTNERRALLCPIEEFLKNEALHNLAAILVDTGAVIVNIITGTEFREEGPKEAKRVQERFEKHFATCSMLVSETKEKMLYCFHKIAPNENKTETLLKMEIEMDKKLGFHLKDGKEYVASDIE